MRTIHFDNPHRQKHFEFFAGMNHPHFGICAHIHVGPWVRRAKELGLRFTPSIVYLLSRAANEIPQFRHRIRDGQIIEHDAVHPSFSVTTQETDVFSFCEVPYHTDAAEFMARAEEQMAIMREAPSIENEPGRDDFLFMSAFPWVVFTGVQQAMHYHPHDSVPRIIWGKLYESGSDLKLPLSVQAHHAVVDGVHMGRYFQRIGQLVDAADETLTA